MTILTARLSSRAFRRSYCTHKNALKSQHIRSRFLDYFVKEKDHVYIKSAPVASYFDSTIPFVNAGMCQFKRVFTGEEEIDCDKAANTQKCIRIGGKHNDLNLVGLDSYHHTFFEMLGNWSFGAYTRKEACSMAWQLLTSPPYSISPNQLFITYFGGDKNLNLPADDEVREIWLELGVPADRILPFGMESNFWEMGLTGPCGTCSEIHVALDDSIRSRSDLVNKNNPMLAELWNIVFIKFNKTENSLDKLPKEFIDTGMGFERLVTLLQGKTSSYDSDLFVPLLNKITQVSGAPAYSGSFGSNNLDSSYRCLADFSRMIAVAISDNIFPDLSHRLRRVLRKALHLAEYKFNCREPSVLLNELSNQVAEMYQDIFPEIGNNLEKVHLTVKYEEKILHSTKNKNSKKWKQEASEYPILESFSLVEYPGLVVALSHILSETESLKKGDCVPAGLIHYLYETYGLDQPVVEKLMDKLEFKVNWNDVRDRMEHVKEASRKLSALDSSGLSVLEKIGIKTDNSFVYSFTKSNDTYEFPEIRADLLAIVKDDDILSVSKRTDEFASLHSAEVEFNYDGEFGLIFDKSNFFCGETGDCRDIGEIIISAGNGSIPLNVLKVEKIKNNIIHYIEPRNKEDKIVLKSGADAVLRIDATKRLSLMQYFTTARLLLKVLEDLYPLVYYKDALIKTDRVKLTCRALGKEFDFVEDKRFMEERMNKYINDGLSLERTSALTVRDVLSSHHIRLGPGVVSSPSALQAINFVDNNGNIVTSDLCNGIYLLNVKDLKNFEILNLDSKADLNISCRVGHEISIMSDEEQLLEKDSKLFADRAKILLNSDDVTVGQILDFNDELSTYLFEVYHGIQNKKYPQTDRMKTYLLMFEALQKSASKRGQKFSQDLVVSELVSRMQKMGAHQKFAVHFCFLDSFWFQYKSFTKNVVCQNEFPTTMFHYSKSQKLLIATAYVPESFVKENFNANLWLRSTCENFGINVIEKEESINYCNLKKKIPNFGIYELIVPLLKTSADIVKNIIE